MTKKTFTGALMTLFMCFVLASCGSGESPKQHEHSYETRVIQPTCTEQGYTLHTCVDGDHSYKDNYTNPLGHNFTEKTDGWYCSRCNKAESDGFTFKDATMDGESCYAITGANASVVVNGVLNIPHKYNSKNVRALMTYSFSGIASSVKKMLVHSNIKNIYSYLWNGTSIWTPDLEFECPIEEVIFDSSCSGMRVESNAFYNCKKLTKVNVSKGMIKYIPCDAVTSSAGSSAEYLFYKTPYFNNNANIKNGLYYIADLLLHADLTKVGENVTIDDGTVAVNACTLIKGTGIKTLVIPKSVGSIGISAFKNCSNLETITYKGTVSDFNKMSIAEGAFSGIKAKKVTCTDGDVTSYTLPNGYTVQIGG